MHPLRRRPLPRPPILAAPIALSCQRAQPRNRPIHRCQRRAGQRTARPHAPRVPRLSGRCPSAPCCRPTSRHRRLGRLIPLPLRGLLHPAREHLLDLPFRRRQRRQLPLQRIPRLCLLLLRAHHRRGRRRRVRPPRRLPRARRPGLGRVLGAARRKPHHREQQRNQGKAASHHHHNHFRREAAPSPGHLARRENAAPSLTFRLDGPAPQTLPRFSRRPRNLAHQGLAATLLYGVYARHCCPRSDGQAGSAVSIATPSSTGSTTLEACPASCPTS